MKNKKKLIVLSTLGAFALLLLVCVFYTFFFQSISMINILFELPKMIANNNDPPENTHAKKLLDPSVLDNDSQILLAEEENHKKNHKDIPAFDSLKENYQGKNNSENIFELGNNIPDPLEDDFDLQANNAMLLHQLEELLTNRYYSEQLVNILNQLAWLGDRDALSALIDGYQKTKYNGDSSSEILKAISKVTNPEVVYDLGDYMNNAIDDEDDTLLVSVAAALSNIGSEEATDMLIHTLSTTPERDNTNSIISKAIASIRNTDVAPILVNMIEEKVNGWEGAMESLLKLGDFGTEKIAKLLTQDENIEYREKLLSVTETMQFDEETYYTINKLAELNEEFEDFFRDAANNLQGDMADPQVQALDLKTRKTSIETQLGPLGSTYDELAADLKELKNTNARVAELESVAAMLEQKLSQSEQKAADLTHALDREKKGQDLLSAERSTKADLVAELQQKLEASLSSRAELENDIEKSKKEIAALQNQLRELKTQKAPNESSAVIVDVGKKSTSKSESYGEQGELPSPSDIIDWVLKRKGK